MNTKKNRFTALATAELQGTLNVEEKYTSARSLESTLLAVEDYKSRLHIYTIHKKREYFKSSSTNILLFPSIP